MKSAVHRRAAKRDRREAAESSRRGEVGVLEHAAGHRRHRRPAHDPVPLDQFEHFAGSNRPVPNTSVLPTRTRDAAYAARRCGTAARCAGRRRPAAGSGWYGRLRVTCRIICWLASSERWASRTALGRPWVPEVKIIAAGSFSSRRAAWRSRGASSGAVFVALPGAERRDAGRNSRRGALRRQAPAPARSGRARRRSRRRSTRRWRGPGPRRSAGTTSS